jgi:diguanylate cyclase (GGDEF)-like protein
MMAVVGRYNILYVDDEPHNLSAFARAFVDADFVKEVITTTSPEEALAILARTEIAAVVSDQRMPGMSGTELLARVVRDHPDTVRIILTGYTDVNDALDAINLGHVYQYITKPWEPGALRLALRNAVEHYELTGALRRKNAELKTAYAELEAAHREQIRLYELVITDEKTGLRNFHYFRIRLGEEFERARRYDSPLAVVMLDLDDLKQLNDRHGHVAGDAALQQVAGLLAAGMRTVDIVARYGGDEFAIILPETGVAGARAIAERARERIAGHAFSAGGAPIRMTASFGIATFPNPVVGSQSDLLLRADQALYRAKAAGKNRVVVDEE